MEETIKDSFGDKEGSILINYSKVRENIKKCREDKQNKVCRMQLKEMGIEFLDT